MLPVRHIHEGADVRPQAALDIAHDADDRARLVSDEILAHWASLGTQRVASGERPPVGTTQQVCLDACADGILPRKELAGHGLIDDGHDRSA